MNRWSLRSRLFVLIILPLIAVACLAGAARYVMAEKISQRLYDNTLLVVALTISRDVILSEGDMLTEQLLDSLTNALGDPVYYRIEGPEGQFVTGYSDAPANPASGETDPGIPFFYNSVSLGEQVRAVTLREFISAPQFGGWVTVDVWQTVKQRDALSMELLIQSIILMTVVISSAGLLVWFGINRGLRPLLKLREAISARSQDDLGPIRRAVPKEVRSLVGAMNSLFARLSEAFALRDAFISDAAHQLRNPIAAIQAQAEAATTAPTEPELRSRVTELAETARRTGRMTQQLLSMEKARGREGPEKWRSIELREPLEDIARRFAEREMRNGVSVSFVTTGPSQPILVDTVMLTEAIENLLDNARRYGCPDGGEVELSLAFNEDHVAIRVTDSGPGIPEDVQDRVFDRFFRLSNDTSGGCGLGLSIVRTVAEMHGGSATVLDSAHGMAVEILIPLAADIAVYGPAAAARRA